MKPFLRAPAARRKVRRGERARKPGLARLLDGRKHIPGRQYGVRGNARTVHPLLDLRLRHRTGLLRQQVRAQVIEELLGIDALEREVVEVAAQERLQLVPAETILQELQEQLALLVGDIRHAVVGIVVAQVDRELLMRRVGIDEVVLQGLEAEHVLHALATLAVERFDDSPLQIHREAFVEPEVAPRRVRDEVA